MSVHSEWYLPGRVILTRAVGTVSDAEVLADDPVILAMLDQGASPLVHMIIDDSQLDNLPNFATFSQLQWGKHERLGWIIVVGVQNKVLIFINLLAANLFRTRQRFLPTLDEALGFLNEVDSTLPPLRPTADNPPDTP